MKFLIAGFLFFCAGIVLSAWLQLVAKYRRSGGTIERITPEFVVVRPVPGAKK